MFHYLLKPFLRLFVVIALLCTISCSSSSNDEESLSAVETRIAVEWMNLTYDLVRQEALSPPVASRIYSYSSIALYEGAVHSSPNLRTLAGQLNGLNSLPLPDENQEYDWQVVTVSSVSEMLQTLFVGRPSALQRIDDLKEMHLGEVAESNPEVFALSQDYGFAIAEGLILWAEQDGFSGRTATPYDLPVCPSCWVPTGAVLSPLEPNWGSLRTFVVSVDECTPAPPVEYAENVNSNFYSEGLAVYEASQTLTDEEEVIAKFWADNPGQTGTPPGHWVSIVSQLAVDNSYSLERAVRTYARVGLAVADAFIACWHTKYQYSLLRPVTYIQRFIDPEWSPLLPTPPFPEYTSGHSTSSGASSEVLALSLGNHGFTDRTSSSLGFSPRSFPSFRAAAEEAAQSRLYGGIHYPMGNENGLEQGKCIGRTIHERLDM